MSRRDQFLSLRRRAPRILPSLLRCDFGNLEREVRRLEAAGLGALHLDVMDGHFVPNFTYGMPLVRAFHQLTPLPLDVHLMMTEPGRYVGAFYEAGAAAMSVHVEALDEPLPVLREIAQLGAAPGLALNPGTPLAAVEPYLDACDFVLVMSVPAGFGGQSFDEGALSRLRQLRQAAGDDLILEIDGGLNMETIGGCARAGAELLVVGSAIFHSPDYGQTVDQLTRAAASA